MKRRRILVAAPTLRLAAGIGLAQGRPKRIGYISFRPGPNEFEQAFLRGLRERGWVEGQNLVINFRWVAFDSQRVAQMVAELLALQPALMVVADAGGARAMIRSQNPAMPIVAHRLPTIFSIRAYLRTGGLMSYGPDLEGAFHRSAYFVDRILKGAKLIDLPIEQSTTFQPVLNQGTAKALGVRFPQALLLCADEVIQ